MLRDSVTADGRRLWAAAFNLGVALGGFFDGVLLHQVLQWHHLLSLVPDEEVQNPRVQVLADGLFHILMYLLALLGLALLWRARAAAAQPGQGLRVAVAAVAGFGAWNVLDAVLFHWVLGVHRIRVDVDSPLAWDLGWLAAFGIVPLALAVVLRRRGGRSRLTVHALHLLAFLVVILGGVALRGPPPGPAVVLFRPGLSHAEVFQAIAAVDGRISAVDRSGELVVAELPPHANPWALYRAGALIVGRTGPSGCLGWSRVA